MTSLPDRVRAAIQAQASQVPPEAVPPLRLPARRRRFFSPAHGGGGRKEAPARRGWLIPVAAALGVAAAVLVPAAVSGRLDAVEPAGGAESASQRWHDAAAQWVASQVSHSAVVSCDPLMCRELMADGFPAGDLLELRPGAGSPLGSSVIVATARLRSAFGSRLTSVYAPETLARFGSGAARIAVRVIAPAGAAAYQAAVSADRAARRQSEAQLLASTRITATARARRQLTAGQADSRLLLILAVLASVEPLSIVTFGDSGPGAPPGIPLRAVTLQPAGHARCVSADSWQPVITFLNRQRPPYHPGQVGIIRRRPGGCAEFRIEFPAPSPLGLLAGGSS